MNITRLTLLTITVLTSFLTNGQGYNFRIRTITAGVSLSSLSDTVTINQTIAFLKKSRTEYTKKGYEVQTLRIVTQNIYEYLGGKSYKEAIPYLKIIDQIAKREDIVLSIGQLLPPNQYKSDIANWVIELIKETDNINFSIPISSFSHGVYPNSIKAAAEVTIALSKNSKGGEGNFRFTASANCPSEIPFFPAAYHKGKRNFAIGIESPNILTEVFLQSDWANAKDNLKQTLESKLRPIETIAMNISKLNNWTYNGIDTSPAPGLDASIGEAIETLTKQPFGEPSTLRACAMITDVLKNLNLKTCGYSGLMLPVIEDKVLAKRAMENRFTVQELLLFSSVSGTGLDVVPIPGDTPLDIIERIYHDVAALSLKYTNKALSARLFLIPGKQAGELVEFDNPYLTSSTVMKIE
ncbi:MAG: DUF711 family protein [Cyclobacteriaceae bacterium]|nr:DUF711 family protein [Cyclobacteriaceae bacterium]